MAEQDGFEVVPLHPFTPKGCKRLPGGWGGGEYVSGPLSADYGLTLPGRPIRVATKEYAETLTRSRLAARPDEMTLEKLGKTYQDAFDNRARWDKKQV